MCEDLLKSAGGKSATNPKLKEGKGTENSPY